MSVETVCLSIAVAEPVPVQFGAFGCFSKSFEQDISHHPVLVLDLILGKLHDHEGLGGNFFRKQEVSKTVNVFEVLPPLKEGVELATDHCPGSVTWNPETVDEDVQVILEQAELNSERNHKVRKTKS